VAGDEEAGTLDLVLAHPVGRVKLALQRFAAVAVELGLACLVLFAAMVAMTGPFGFDGISAAEFAATHLQLALFGLCFGALAFAIGAATGSRTLALWGSAAVALLAYVAKALLPQVPGLGWARDLSPFQWFIGGDPLTNGLQVGGCLLLLGTSAVLLAVGTAAFTRRDLAT
jgi:ABC-2 type transport system permease protein